MEGTGEQGVQRVDKPENPAPIVILNPPKMPGSGPPCIFDGGPTQRTGACYTCILCGSTTSCG